MSKPASSKINSSWLLTCSDLFFLLVAFFVLNHALILKNKETKYKEEIAERAVSTVAQSKARFSYEYKNNKDDVKKKDLPYLVNGKWFQEGFILNAYGEMQIALIVKTVKEFSGSARINVYLPVDKHEQSESKELHAIQNMLLERNGQKSPVSFFSDKNIDTSKIELVVRF